MAIVVEFAGIPCSGKSTALRSLFNKSFTVSAIDAEMALNRYYTDNICLYPIIKQMRLDSLIKSIILLLIHAKYVFIYREFYCLCLRGILICNSRVKTLRSFFFKIGKYFLLKKK